MKRNYFICFLVVLFTLTSTFSAKAGEGMWLPKLIGKNFEEMKRLGFKLTPEDIYNVNKASLKDAIVSFGFCTGEIISQKGLILTNHHCAFGSIQEHSSIDKDYLADGFWADSYEKELPATGVTASILVRMEDVTEKMMASDDPTAQKTAMDEIISTAIEGTVYNAVVKDVFGGNQYFLFVYETFPDVRLVGAPPSSIGKFGGDTDNWIWPRHTGDFSLFRIYMGKDGKPSPVSADNVPYKPKKSLKLNIGGIKENDFTMIMGYPGSTNRYAFSRELDNAVKSFNPAIITMLGLKLELMKEDMDADRSVNIKLAGSYASLSNGYKYYQGQNEGLQKLDIIDQQRTIETDFIAKAKKNPKLGSDFANIFDEVETLYDNYVPYSLNNLYISLGGLASEASRYGLQFIGIKRLLDTKKVNEEALNGNVNRLKAGVDEHFKNYNAPTDKKIFAKLLYQYYVEIDPAQRPEVITKIAEKGKGKTIEEKFDNYAEKVFSKSIFVDKTRMKEFLSDPSAKALKKDPLMSLISSLQFEYRPSYGDKSAAFSQGLAQLKEKYIKGLMETNEGKLMYPDANSTLRVTYGQVKNYKPRDAVNFNYYTTADGILQKYSPGNYEFDVPQKLRELIQKKDFGPYVNDKGEMVVAFISTNDITGGNSGSPIMNDRGEIIGIAFDGNWEAMTGDLVFDKKFKRTINVDIRYVLFIIDKFAGAKNLIAEMDIIK
ncbi:MAG: hypothetical protein ACJATA_001024 [Sphingobacteriales bacterium]|jgi:hypothetical protein